MANERVYKITINGITESVTQVDVLLAKLNELDERIKNITKQGVKIKIGKGDIDIDSGQITENINSLAGMRKELSRLKKEFVNMDFNDANWTKLRDKVLQTNNAVKSVEQSIGIFSRNVGNYTNSFLAAFDKFPQSVRDTLQGLKSFNSEAVTLEQKINTVHKSMSELGATKIDTDAYKALEEVLKNLYEAQAQVNESIKNAQDRTHGINDIAETFKSATGAIQVAAGAMSMFGGKSDDAVKAIKKLQEIQTIANGLKDLSTSVQKSGALWKVWTVALTMTDKVLALLPARFRAVTAAETATAAGTKAVTGAMNGLRVAIASTGIGLLVVLVGAAVSKLIEMGNATEDAKDELQSMNDYISGTLQDTLKNIDFKKSIGELSELGAAKKGLEAAKQAMADFGDVMEKVGKKFDTDWYELWDKYVKGLDINVDTKEAENAIQRFNKILKEPFKSIDDGNDKISEVRKLIVAVAKDGSDAAKFYNDAMQQFIQNGEVAIQMLQRIKQAELDLAKTIQENNAQAISNTYLRGKAMRDLERQERIKGYEAQLKEDQSNAEEIREAIASVNRLYDRQDREEYQRLLDDKARLLVETKANEIKAGQDTLQARKDLIDEEEKAALKSARKQASEALLTAKQREELLTSIRNKYKKQREDAEREWYKQMNNTIISLTKDLNNALLNLDQTSTSFAEQQFNIDELKRSFNKYKNEFVKDIADINDMAELAVKAIGIPALGDNGYDPTKAWTKPIDEKRNTNFYERWSDTLLNTLKYTQEEVDKIMGKIAVSMSDRLVHAGVDVSAIDEISDIQLKVNALVDLIYNNKDKLEQSRNDVENYAESIVGSLALISNGLYDANKEYPELIREVDDFYSEYEARVKTHLEQQLKDNKENETKRYEQAVEALAQERDLKLKDIDNAVGDEEHKKSQIELINKTYNAKISAETNTHNANMLRMENDYTNKVSSVVIERYDSLLGMYEQYDSEIQLRLLQSQRHSTNSWNIVNIVKVRRDLNDAKKEYEQFGKDFTKLTKELDVAFSKGEISVDQYNAKYKELIDKSRNAKDAMEDINTQSKESIGDFISSLNVYFSAAVNGFNDILNAVGDIQAGEFERQMKKLELENDRLSELLSQQQEIVQNHVSKIDEIEGELGTARGDRRDQLVAALNAEKLAREKAFAEEKKIQKEKEANERQQRELDYKEKIRQWNQQKHQAYASAALAVANALATQPFVPVGIAMGALATSLGAVQIAAIIKNKPVKYAQGGLLEGQSHAQGGIQVPQLGAELEGGEFVINKRSTSMNYGLIDFINHSKKRIDIADLVEFYYTKPSSSNASPKKRYAEGGKLPIVSTIDIGNNTQHITVSMDDTPIVVSVEEITQTQEHIKEVKTLAGVY